MTKIVINRPSDPLTGTIDRHRRAYARKWLLPVHETTKPAERAPAPAMAERRGIAEKIIEIFASHGFGRVE